MRCRTLDADILTAIVASDALLYSLACFFVCSAASLLNFSRSLRYSSPMLATKASSGSGSCKSWRMAIKTIAEERRCRRSLACAFRFCLLCFSNCTRTCDRLCAWLPRFCLQDADAQITVVIDVRMIDGCLEANLGALERVLDREVDLKVESSALVRRLGRLNSGTTGLQSATCAANVWATSTPLTPFTLAVHL